MTAAGATFTSVKIVLDINIKACETSTFFFPLTFGLFLLRNPNHNSSKKVCEISLIPPDYLIHERHRDKVDGGITESFHHSYESFARFVSLGISIYSLKHITSGPSHMLIP